MTPDEIQSLITGTVVALTGLVAAITGLLAVIVRLRGKAKKDGKVNTVLMAAVKKATAEMDMEQSLAMQDSISLGARDAGVGSEMDVMLAQAHDDGTL